MQLTGPSRRQVLTVGAAVTAAAVLTDLGAPAQADAATNTWAKSASRNGWPVLQAADSFVIEGSGHSVRLADGDAATVLLHIARRFHYEIDALRSGDVHGWTDDRSVSEAYESNYLSGSALAIRPAGYPVGAHGNFYPNEMIVIRDILAELDGVVAWGGDFTTPKESHFEIAVRPAHPRLKGVARKIRGWDEDPGMAGAGATDAFEPARMKRARAFQSR
ncbi:hypothetical protein [Streptomyces sp. NPDC005876]|uniref:hypothetical protein n=1 Tax=unclassified Streptomyces TaxID=2593676 RepID=UPI0033DC2E67